jgi:hypothetical protein
MRRLLRHPVRRHAVAVAVSRPVGVGLRSVDANRLPGCCRAQGGGWRRDERRSGCTRRLRRCRLCHGNAHHQAEQRRACQQKPSHVVPFRQLVAGRLPRTVLDEWGWRACGCRAGFYSKGDSKPHWGRKLEYTLICRSCRRQGECSADRIPNCPLYARSTQQGLPQDGAERHKELRAIRE